jgi:hypothetical protein
LITTGPFDFRYRFCDQTSVAGTRVADIGQLADIAEKLAPTPPWSRRPRRAQ